MMAMGIILFVLLLALLILFFLKQLWSRRHLPPGPLALPLVGTLWAGGILLREDYFLKVYSVFPRLMSYLPGPHKQALASVDLIVSFAKQEIEKHKESCSLHEPQDFIDYYLLKMEKSRNDPDSTYSEENLAQCIFDFFVAGIDTTSATLLWALLLLANHPDIQKKVQKEIEDVFGLSGSISYQDRKKLPYTNAVIHEMQRVKYATLSGLPRQSTKDVQMRGYHIPKHVKRYGKIYSMWAGPQLIVVLSGFKAVKEGMTNFREEFSNRIEDPFFTALGKGMGIILSNGLTWKQQRHIGITSLRKLGLGKKSIEHQIEDAAQKLVEVFRQKKGQPFDPTFPIQHAISNVICSLSFGHQFAPEDENFQKLMKALEIIVKITGDFFHLMYNVFPRLMSYLPGPHKQALASVELIVAFAKQEIEKHKESSSQHEPQDFIDYYLFQMEKSRNDPDSTYSEENLAQCVFDFFVAGIDTTSATLLWALLLLANHPDIQKKVQKEIEDVFGLSGSISYQDRKKLPYTNAVIHEMQRVKYATLSGLPRQSTKDVEMRGYHIPKGTVIVPDLRSILLDPEQWETPKEFNPNHFLDKDGKFIDREEFLPFGLGQRACIGQQLARIEIFIFLTSLLRAFSFQWPEGVKELNQPPIVKITVHPQPYKLCAIPTQA
ncbi:cytochrome P450 2J2-like [Pituophis catenifer annectens]|uniref:cytochrome P450 2J2-like n=1 Tax=Pituophis catenifer annectens TaxID=94852 RepID=UPI003994B8CF